MKKESKPVSEFAEITPLHLAEELSGAQVKKFYKGRKRPYLELSRTAQYLLELLLHSGADAFSGEYDLLQNNFAALTEGNLPYSDPAFNVLYTESLILEAQLPVFEARARQGFDLPVDDMGAVHAAMTSILSARVKRQAKHGLKAPLHESRRAEVEIASLLSRLGIAALFPYWSVAREERNHQYGSLNHDCYVVTEKGKKVPIQVKTARHPRMRDYDDRVLVIARTDLATVCEKADVTRGGISKLIAGEQDGRLTYPERNQLNALSGYIVDLVQEHIETNLQ